MTTSNLEDKIRQLEEKIERQDAYHQIANLFARYEYKLHTGQFEDVEDMFALKSPDVRAEIGPWGAWIGEQGIRRCYTGLHRFLGEQGKKAGKDKGIMTVGVDCSPVIEVAKDGQTARGLWISPCMMTRYIGDELQSMWFWQKRAADFKKEDGEWKIWHYHIYGIFTCPYEKSPSEAGKWDPMENVGNVVPDEYKSDRPPSYFWVYDPNEIVEIEPPPPEPYNTFSETESY